jgi:hypothetical protein
MFTVPRLVQTLAAVLLSSFLGLHWVVLQSAGWASMLAQRVQTSSWSEAIRTTFDGQHPCTVCKLVVAGHQAEKQAPDKLAVDHFEIAALEGQGWLPAAPSVAPVTLRPLPVPPSRGFSPPVPPPRSA